MARAKRTARADARRRYRAAMGDPSVEAAEGELDAEPTVRPARTAAPRAAAAPPERPSITGAFRGAFRPIDLRGDLRALPGLLISRAFLVPLDLSGAAFIAFALQQGPLTAFFYQYFSYQFPVAAVFVAGFFASRASWLLGGIIAIASTFFQLPLLVGQPIELVLAVLVQGAIYGSFFGAAAAWYRRFLNRANPNRMTARPAGSSRRPDGKIAKKPEPRPMLARRR